MRRADMLTSALSALLADAIAKEHIAGCSIAIEQNGNRILTLPLGVDRSDTIYRIFSMTKPVTAVAILSLAEEKRLSLSQPVSDFLPAYRHVQIATETGLSVSPVPITIEMLLHMTAGIPYPNALGLPAERAMFSVQAAIQRQANADPAYTTQAGANALAAAPLLFTPGTRYHYGACADVLGGVLEAVTGQSPEAFLQDRIFRPLGMADTSFLLSERMRPRLSGLYSRTGKLHLANPRMFQTPLLRSDATNGRFLPCGAGLHSTLEDYLRFQAMLLDNGALGEARILRPETVQFLRTCQMPPSVRNTFSHTGGEGYAYSNLVGILVAPAAAGYGSVGAYGWDGLTGNFFLNDPSRDLSICYMQQLVEGADFALRKQILQTIYRHL